MGQKEAIREIENNIGLQFSPRIATALLAAVRKGNIG
jgi:hypothetical protein